MDRVALRRRRIRASPRAVVAVVAAFLLVTGVGLAQPAPAWAPSPAASWATQVAGETGPADPSAAANPAPLTAPTPGRGDSEAAVPGSASNPGLPRTHDVPRAGTRVREPSPPKCDRSLRPKTEILFNDPSGSRSAQFKILTHLVRLIDCTPSHNPDGSQASIHASFYSLSYAPVRKSLVSAAHRGVSVQVLANSHSDRLQAWVDLTEQLGTSTTGNSFAVTCWQGCLRPRQAPSPGGPTAWYSARSEAAESSTMVFSDHSKAGEEPITSWDWDFGDGTHATGPGPHLKTYNADGRYPTSLTVRDSAGASHQVTGTVTIPDALEPMYPAMHSKLFLFSTVNSGKRVKRWVSTFGSGNPTYEQSRKGFNNLNVSVGDLQLYQALDRYFADLVAGSQGALLAPSYYRTAVTPGNAATGSPPRTIHFLPQAAGDVQLDVLRSIQCRYTQNGVQRRTAIRISMFALNRTELAAELWRLAYERGCDVDVVYTTMSQRLRDADDAWVRTAAGELAPWGPADCLATPPTRAVLATVASGPPRMIEVSNSLDVPAGLCGGGHLDGELPTTGPGTWLDRTSPISQGRLRITATCTAEPFFDRILRRWALRCGSESLFTHQKVMLLDGMVHGKVQKYVLTGSANWSLSAKLLNDELVVETQDAAETYDAYLKAYRHQKRLFTAATVDHTVREQSRG